jgi:hypothetical protein
MEQRYWVSNGKHEALAATLREMIPASGSVLRPRKNKALEKFRKACNCYYDLYNNGLINRAREFAGVFGIASSQYKYTIRYPTFDSRLYTRVEAKMDEIVLDAALEQGLINMED